MLLIVHVDLMCFLRIFERLEAQIERLESQLHEMIIIE